MMAFLLPEEKEKIEITCQFRLMRYQEKDELVENFDQFKKLKHSSASLKVFIDIVSAKVNGLVVFFLKLKSKEELMHIMEQNMMNNATELQS